MPFDSLLVILILALAFIAFAIHYYPRKKWTRILAAFFIITSCIAWQVIAPTGANEPRYPLYVGVLILVIMWLIDYCSKKNTGNS